MIQRIQEREQKDAGFLNPDALLRAPRDFTLTQAKIFGLLKGALPAVPSDEDDEGDEGEEVEEDEPEHEPEHEPASAPASAEVLAEIKKFDKMVPDFLQFYSPEYKFKPLDRIEAEKQLDHKY